MPEEAGADVAILLKGYPRTSETFIARELLELQEPLFVTQPKVATQEAAVNIEETPLDAGLEFRTG